MPCVRVWWGWDIIVSGVVRCWLKQMGGRQVSALASFHLLIPTQPPTHSTAQHTGNKHTRLVSRMSKGPSPRPRRRRRTVLLLSSPTTSVIMLLLAAASAVRAAAEGVSLAFVHKHAGLPAKRRMLTAGTRTMTMPSSTRIRSASEDEASSSSSSSSTRIRGAAGGNEEGSSSPLLLDERISLAPMMEYTDRYEVSTQTQKGQGPGGRE